MARFALVKVARVVSVVEMPAIPTVDLGGIWVDVGGNLEVSPDWGYVGGVFTPPSRERGSLSPKEFWKRFTPAEREALQDKLATGTQAVKNKLNAFRDYVQTGGNVELGDDYIIASVTQMEVAGILSAGRAAVILSGAG